MVALGGGHGLANSLRGLRTCSDAITAVVSVADDGGSSGRLRQMDPALLPPGDLRMALAALADPARAEWATVVAHRLRGSGDAAGHAVGNLVLAGLSQVLHDPVAALDAFAAVLGVAPTARVLPAVLTPLTICAEVSDGAGQDLRTVRGQVAVATTTGRVVAVYLEPPEPPACPEALAAIGAADVLVLGPGSLFTSVLPHLLVPAVREAVQATAAMRVLVLNLAAQPGETDGFSAETHLEVLAAHAPDLTLDVVIADGPAGAPPPRALAAAAADLGATVLCRPVAVRAGSPVHDPERLGRAFADVLGGALPPPGAGTARTPGAPVPPRSARDAAVRSLQRGRA